MEDFKHTKIKINFTMIKKSQRTKTKFLYEYGIMLIKRTKPIYPDKNWCILNGEIIDKLEEDLNKKIRIFKNTNVDKIEYKGKKYKIFFTPLNI